MQLSCSFLWSYKRLQKAFSHMHKYFPKTFKHTVMCEVEFALTSVFSSDKHQQLQNVFVII